MRITVAVLLPCVAGVCRSMSTLLSPNNTKRTHCVCDIYDVSTFRKDYSSGQNTWIISTQAFQAALTRRLMKLPRTCCPMRLRWAACPSPSSPLCRYSARQCSTACSFHAELLALAAHDRLQLQGSAPLCCALYAVMYAHAVGNVCCTCVAELPYQGTPQAHVATSF